MFLCRLPMAGASDGGLPSRDPASTLRAPTRLTNLTILHTSENGTFGRQIPPSLFGSALISRRPLGASRQSGQFKLLSEQIMHL